VQKAPNISSQPARRKIPKALVYEMDNGKPIFYRNYRKVLDGKLTVEQIRARPLREAFLLILIHNFFHNLKLKKIDPLLAIGLDLGNKNFREVELGVCSKIQFTKQLLENVYLNIPPKLVFCIDNRKPNILGSEIIYYVKKIEALLKFGIKKIIWIFTGLNKIMTATNAKKWTFFNWDEDIEVMKGITMNLQELINNDKILKQIINLPHQ